MRLSRRLTATTRCPVSKLRTLASFRQPTTIWPTSPETEGLTSSFSVMVDNQDTLRTCILARSSSSTRCQERLIQAGSQAPNMPTKPKPNLWKTAISEISFSLNTMSWCKIGGKTISRKVHSEGFFSRTALVILAIWECICHSRQENTWEYMISSIENGQKAFEKRKRKTMYKQGFTQVDFSSILRFLSRLLQLCTFKEYSTGSTHVFSISSSPVKEKLKWC